MVWTVRGGVPRCVDVLQGHASRIFAGTTDGSKFVWTGGWDKSILVWNWATHTFVKAMEVRHEDAISVLVWVGKVGPAREDMLISGSWDGRIILWVNSVDVEKPRGSVKVSKSVSDHWQPVVLGQSVADHWGVSASPVSYSAPNSPPDEGVVDTIGKGLRLLGKSPSRSTLLAPSEPSPSSPRGASASANNSPSLSAHRMSMSAGALRQARRPVNSHDSALMGTKSRSSSFEGKK